MNATNSTGDAPINDVTLGNFTAAVTTNAIVASVFLLVFVLVRRVWKEAYETKGIRGSLSMHLINGDSSLADTIGFDSFAAFVFVRTLSLLFVCATIPALVLLLPLNTVSGSGSGSGLDVSSATGLNVLSLAHVSDSDRLWGHFVVLVWVAGGAVFAAFSLLSTAVQLRQRFLLNASTAGRVLMVRDVPREWRTTEKLTVLFNRICPDSVDSIVIPHKVPSQLAKVAKKQLKFRSLLESAICSYYSKSSKQFGSGIESEDPEAQQFLPISDSQLARRKLRPTHRVPSVYGEKVDSISNYSAELRDLNKKLQDLKSKQADDTPASTIFIVFKEPFQAHLAASTVISDAPAVMGEKVANVNSKDVIWQNVRLPFLERQGRGFVSGVIMFFMILLWGSIVAFIVALADIKSLGDRIPAFETFIKNNQTLANIIRTPLKTQTEQKVFSTYFLFQLCNVFLINVVGSSILASLTEFQKGTDGVMQILAIAIPNTNPHPHPPFGNTPRTLAEQLNPPQFSYATAMSVHCLATVIGLVYAIITPIVLIFITVYFCLYTCVYGYLFRYVYAIAPETDTGGRYLFQAVRHLFWGCGMEGRHTGFSWWMEQAVIWLFPGLSSAEVEKLSEEKLKELYSNPAGGSENSKLWIPHCAVWGIEEEVLNDLHSIDVVNGNGARVSAKGKVIIDG
ncbi:hypothetical protein BCR33DRAFT_713327 [Rhizoclosmatium globosum]|uniref:DUF221-domain-containing protein n=1 Tax=Rhizoclosmatium globosum TaxID=329046 RepID=A0A1Y2CUP1_9FUNG|nr:hypothetical protein BCR33DRAFT_713327 [Rhizoclosmatium globosum]|eukprot:ORY50554.1 hypothetical protein BCR33DRAFT_713327 [Rhizoclosmatium globosum]